MAAGSTTIAGIVSTSAGQLMIVCAVLFGRVLGICLILFLLPQPFPYLGLAYILFLQVLRFFASSFSVSLSLSPSHPPSLSLSLLSLLSPLTPSPKPHVSSCDGINSHCCRSLITVVAAPMDRWRFNRDRIVTSVAGSLQTHA